MLRAFVVAEFCLDASVRPSMIELSPGQSTVSEYNSSDEVWVRRLNLIRRLRENRTARRTCCNSGEPRRASKPRKSTKFTSSLDLMEQQWSEVKAMEFWQPALYWRSSTTTVITVVLQRFAEDPLIVSDLVYLDDAPKGEDGRPRKEGTLEMVRRAVWGMLYADDAGVVSTSPRGLTRMMGVIVVTCQEFGLTVSEKKTEAMHLWSHPHTTSNALRIEAAGQRYKQTTEFVYLGGAISESADLDIEIKRRIGAAWASVRKYSSQLYDRRNARLSLKIRLFKAEVMEAMLYGCATWTMRSQDFSSLRTAHHKLLLRIIGFRRKDRIGYKPLSYREVLERTGSERIETTIRKRQLGFAGALVRQGDSRLSKRVMFGRLAVQGPKRGGRPATSWVDCLQKNLEAFGAIPRKGKGRKWVAFGVVVKDGRDWMTAAKNMDKWHRGVERGAEALDSAWRRADLRQSNVQLQR